MKKYTVTFSNNYLKVKRSTWTKLLKKKQKEAKKKDLQIQEIFLVTSKALQQELQHLPK